MNRIALFALFLVALTTVAVVGQEMLVVGIDRSFEAEWETIVGAFERQTGIKVDIQAYPQNAIAQQVVYQAFSRSGRHHFFMVPDSWGIGLSRYVADLSDVANRLSAAGVSPVYVSDRPLGVPLPFASGWFLAVLSWPDDREAAEAFLIAAAGGEAVSATAPPIFAAPSAVVAPTNVATLTTEKMARANHNPKVDGALGALLAAAEATVSSAASQIAAALPTTVRTALEGVARTFGVPFSAATSSVTVVLEPRAGAGSASTVAALSSLGIRQSSIDPGSTLVKVTVPLTQLSSLVSGLSGVSFFRAPYVPFPLGTPSEGTAAIGADGFHAAGFTGAGAKVAVIDLGFVGLTQAQARGDLPYSVTQNDLTGTGLTTGYSHGTAVAEVIHDIAPDAQLYLIKIADEVDLDQAVTYCLSQGIDVINHSLGWYNTNFYDGTGTIPDIARRATSGGILWVNAAGNEAESHWEGTFVDGNADGWHDTSASIYASSGSQITLYLTWNEWPAASTDYDLYLYDAASQVVASSTKYQTGVEEPTESIQVTAPQSGTYTIRVKGSGSRRIELYSVFQNLSPAISSSSVLAPANAATVVAVGAVDHNDYTTGPLESYSSRGPSNDGRSKPDLVAPDNVTTGTSPYTTFPGTSGSAPHAAGAAALLLSQQPTLSEPALRSLLLSQTVAMGSANLYGNGRLFLQPPTTNQPPTASFTYSPTDPTVGQTVSFSGAASSDPDGAIVSYRWDLDGDGFDDATGVSAARAFSSAGTYSVRLTVTDDDGASDSIVRQVSVGVAAAPDLAVSSLTFSPSTPTVGQSLTFSFTIRNVGTASAGTFRVRLQGTTSSTQTYLSGISAGASRTASLSLPLSATSETFTLTADDLGQVSESNEGNNTRSVTVTASTPPRPTADAGGPYAGTAGLPIAFEGSGSTGTITSYQWYFGDGATGTGSAPSHAYATPGTYTVTLVVTGPGGQSSDGAQVSVGQPQPALSAQLSLPKPTYEVGEPLVVSYTTNRTAYVYLCEVTPDGRVVLLYPSWFERENPVPAGSHTVPGGGYTLRVTEPTGGESLYLFASTQPIPGFPTSFGFGFPVISTSPGTFRDQTIAAMQSSVPSGDWSFDTLSFDVVPEAPTTGSVQIITFPSSASVTLDGSPIGTSPVTRSGVAPGSHTVRASKPGYQPETRAVTVVAGQTTTVEITLVAEPANQPPNASFNHTPNAPVVGETVQFDGRSSSDPDGTIVAYEWSFGDGGSAAGAVVSHAFAAGQTYPVTLTVRDDDGATDSVTRSITVSPPAAGTLRVLSTPSGANVQLDGVSIGTTPLTRSGVSPGAHTVNVSKLGYQPEARSVAIQADQTTTVDLTLTLVPQPDLDLAVSVSKPSYEVGDEIVITVETNRTAYVYVCEVSPDGTVTLLFPNAAEPNNVLPAGSRRIPAQDAGFTLRASEPLGEETLYTFTATGPIPGFPTVFNGGFPVLSTTPGAFRDGVLQTLNGQFAAGDWAFDTLSFDVVAASPNQAPIVSFGSFDREVLFGGPKGKIKAILRPVADVHDEDGQIMSYLWNWGDGTTSTGPTPQHEYKVPAGSYVLTLTVTDDDGASTTVSTTITVSEALDPGSGAP